MEKYDIHYLPIAEADLNEIIDYLLTYSVNAANKFIDELEGLEERLSIFPASSPPIRDKKLQSKDYRVAAIGDYLLFYTLRNECVYVMGVLHGKRNYLSIL